MMRLPILLALTVAMAAQDTTFRAVVPVVLVPTTVTDQQGRFINGLEAEDFLLLEDQHPRPIRMDTPETLSMPFAVVILVQANNTAPAALLKIQKIGSMIQPLITGERGKAAVLAFGSECKLVQDFTSDPVDLTRAFRRIRTQGEKTARMLDATAEAMRMFRARPDGERRVVFVISESRDRGSKTKLDDLLKQVELEGVSLFPIVYSAYVTPFTTRADELPPPESFDPLALITEPLRMARTETAEVLARYSGGRKTRFATLHGLERIVTSLGEELHGQYLLSYTSPSCTPGLHRIEVQVRNRPEAVVRARYAYWTEGESCSPAPAPR